SDLFLCLAIKQYAHGRQISGRFGHGNCLYVGAPQSADLVGLILRRTPENMRKAKTEKTAQKLKGPPPALPQKSSEAPPRRGRGPPRRSDSACPPGAAIGHAQAVAGPAKHQ